jgi:carboxypeptidase family protein
MTPWSMLGVVPFSFLIAACATASVVRGRVVDAESGAPIPHARVRVPSLNLDIEADSVGYFSFATPREPGCYVISAVFIGYGATFRTVRLPIAPGPALEIPLRGAPILEWRGLYLQQCAASDSIRVLWGMDTVRVP